MIHAEYSRMFDALRQRDIRFCLLRDEIADGSLVDDLDLMVESSRFHDAIDALRGLGFQVRVSDKHLPLKSVLVAFRNGRFIVIDLHRTVVQNGIIVLSGDSVLSRMPKGQLLPGAADLLLILLFHNVIGKSEIQEKHVSTILHCHEQTNAEQIRHAVGDPGLAEIVDEVLDDLDSIRSDPARIQALRDRLLVAFRRTDPAYPRRQLRARLRRLRRRFRLRPIAPLYSLTGVDGVGKSSLSAELHRLLNQPGGFRAEEMYMGPWGHYQLSFMSGELFVPGWSVDTREWLRRMVSAPKGGRPGIISSIRLALKSISKRSLTEEESKSYAAVRQSSRLLLTARYVRSVLSAARFLILLSIEMYYRYFQAYRLRRRGTIVIADRYIYDLMTGRMHQMIPQYRRVRALLCRVFPRPTAVFLLYNDPETVLARKQDLKPDMLLAYMKLYEELATRHGFSRIRTDRPPTDLASSIVQERLGEILETLRLR